MATTVRLLTDNILSGVPYKAGDLVSIDDTTAGTLVTGKMADNNASAIARAVTEGEVIQYPAVDATTYGKGPQPAGNIEYFDYLSQRPDAVAYGKRACQIGHDYYVSDGATWLGPLGAGGGGIAAGRTVNASTTLALADANTRITGSHATVAIVATIPNDSTVAWPDEAVIVLYQGLAAAVSFAAGSGVTLRAPTGAPTSVQYGDIAVRRVGPNEWSPIL